MCRHPGWHADPENTEVNMERKQITGCVLVSLFAALIAAGAFVRIPFVPVPITLQTLFALMAALCLPVHLAVLSVAAYLVLGAAGLPIFTSGGGFAALLGPTGGYLIGMIPAVIAGGFMARAFAARPKLAAVLGSIAADALIYLIGIPWLAVSMDISITAALVSGLVPFIPGDALKIAVAASVSPLIRPRVQEMLDRE